MKILFFLLLATLFLSTGCATHKCNLDSMCPTKFKLKIENNKDAILVKVNDQLINTLEKRPKTDYKDLDLQEIMPYIWDSAEFDLIVNYPCDSSMVKNKTENK